MSVARSGTWRSRTHGKITFTDADMYKLCENFERLRDRVWPFLRMGHSREGEDGTLFEQPAVGLVTKLDTIEQDGAVVVMATVIGVPSSVAEACLSGAYPSRSPEIHPKYEDVETVECAEGGHITGPVLRSVTLTGASKPAIRGLFDLECWLRSNAQEKE
jgi:hypothetical protein